MNIELKKIHISNFKGIKDLAIDFGEVTNVMADNGKGKTTIFDAFCWVLFGKDSLGNAKFNIRPIGNDGIIEDFVDITVEIILAVDSEELVLKKVQKQKWVKRRNSENKSFDGNINEYEIDGFPKSERDFNTEIQEIIDESVFMITTNPSYFPAMKWQEQRTALIELVSEVQNIDVIETREDFEIFKDMLEKNDIDAWKAKYAKALKEYKKDIESIPSRVDEVSRNIVEVDYSNEEKKLKELQLQLKEKEDEITDSSKGFEKVLEINQNIFKLKSEIQKLENELRASHDKGLSKLREEKDRLDREFNSLFEKDRLLKSDVEDREMQLRRLEDDLPRLRESFKEIEQEVLKKDSLNCPTCNQVFPESRVAEIEEGFNESKTQRLLSTRDKGIQTNKDIEGLKVELGELKSELEKTIVRKTEVVGEKNQASKNIEEYPELKLVDNAKWVDLGAQLKDLEYQLSNMDDGKAIAEQLKIEKSNIQEQIDEVNKTLNNKEVIENAKNRVKELAKEQKDLAVKVSKVEGMLFLIDEFTKAKMDMLSDLINNKFKLVKWNLFNTQINGAIKETCELTLNGVPYSDLNSAGKVQAGLDIINTMSAKHEAAAPIFIDNREGVNEIPDMEAQVINLMVTKDHEIKVEVE